MKISAGSPILDELLEGGYEKDIINTIYGPAGSGKTLLCLLALIKVAEQGKKITYTDKQLLFSHPALDPGQRNPRLLILCMWHLKKTQLLSFPAEPQQMLVFLEQHI